MGPYDSPVKLVSKFGVNRTFLTMRVELGSNLQSRRKRVELSNPTTYPGRRSYRDYGKQELSPETLHSGLSSPEYVSYRSNSISFRR